jgi:hypothetical protein
MQIKIDVSNLNLRNEFHFASIRDLNINHSFKDDRIIYLFFVYIPLNVSVIVIYLSRDSFFDKYLHLFRNKEKKKKIINFLLFVLFNLGGMFIFVYLYISFSFFEF